MTRTDIPDPADFANAQDYIRACARWLLDEAANYDVVVTITQESYPPLAMRRYHSKVETRDQR